MYKSGENLTLGIAGGATGQVGGLEVKDMGSNATRMRMKGDGRVRFGNGGDASAMVDILQVSSYNALEITDSTDATSTYFKRDASYGLGITSSNAEVLEIYGSGAGSNRLAITSKAGYNTHGFGTNDPSTDPYDATKQLVNWNATGTEIEGQTPGTYTFMALNGRTSNIDDANDYPYSLNLLGPGTQFWSLGEGLSFSECWNYYGNNLDARLITMHDGNSVNGKCDGGITFQGQSKDGSTSAIMHCMSLRNNSGEPRLGLGIDKRVPTAALDVQGSGKFSGSVDIGSSLDVGGSVTADSLVVQGTTDMTVNDVDIDIVESANTNTSTETGFTIQGDMNTYDSARRTIFTQKYQGSQSTAPRLHIGFQNTNGTKHNGIINL